MPDYDDTNRGALFQPKNGEGVKFMGKINIEGDERRYAVIVTRGRDGEVYRSLYERVGPVFQIDEEKRGEKSPHYSGPLDRPAGKQFAMWKGRTRDDSPYISVAISDRRSHGSGGDDGGGRREDQTSSRREDLDDEIPF